MIKMFLSRSFDFFMLAFIFLQSACQKEEYISRKDFLDQLAGEWHVQRLGYGISNCYLLFLEEENELAHHNGNGQMPEYYQYNDPGLCNVPDVLLHKCGFTMKSWS